MILRIPDTIQLTDSFIPYEACKDNQTQIFGFIKTTLEVNTYVFSLCKQNFCAYNNWNITGSNRHKPGMGQLCPLHLPLS